MEDEKKTFQPDLNPFCFIQYLISQELIFKIYFLFIFRSKKLNYIQLHKYNTYENGEHKALPTTIIKNI